MDVDKIAEAIAGDATCAQGEFWQRKTAVVSHLMETGHELAASLCENERLRAALNEIQAYSVGDPRPHTWYFDRAEQALNPGQSTGSPSSSSSS